METLYSGAGIHVSRAKNAVWVVRGTKYYDLAVSVGLFPLMLIIVVGCTAVFVRFSPGFFQESLAGDLAALLGLGLFGLLMILTQLCTVLMVVFTLQAGLPRRFLFDLDGQVCRVRHLPGLSRSIPLDRIESFHLVSGRSRSCHSTALYVREAGKRRSVRIAEFVRRKQPQNGVSDELRVVGEILSGELGHPLKIHDHGSP